MGNKRIREGGESFVGKHKKITLMDTKISHIDIGKRENKNSLAKGASRFFN